VEPWSTPFERGNATAREGLSDHGTRNGPRRRREKARSATAVGITGGVVETMVAAVEVEVEVAVAVVAMAANLLPRLGSPPLPPPVRVRLLATRCAPASILLASGYANL
jgi:hypothetical protein